MDFVPWLSLHWFTLLQSIGIVGGLLFTGVSLRIDTKVRRVSTLITITQQHRDIWTQLYRRPEMARHLPDPYPAQERKSEGVSQQAVALCA